MIRRTFLLAASAIALISGSIPAEARPQWTQAQAKAWYDRQPWLVGSNYTPASAVNEIEMWHPATFDPAGIDREFALAESIGMNSMRVFLHNLLWENDPEGFKQRLDQFLQIAARHKIRPMFVLFDSVWDPNPVYGPQTPPIP
ncbi:MAG: 1,4-beta-xylanase, partial [Sphingomicrobium sp.]